MKLLYDRIEQLNGEPARIARQHETRVDRPPCMFAEGIAQIAPDRWERVRETERLFILETWRLVA